MISKFKEHSEKVSSNLRAIKSDDPHKYWTTLKAAVKSKTECAIPPADFEEHFKALNEVSSQDEFDPNSITSDTNLCTAIQAELDKPFTLEELSKSIKSLKNNKSCGPDQICNEQIKATFEIMKNFYLKLFNGILDSGIFPDSWAEGLIVPIYKKKGNKDDPNNYRGITLLSCLGKYFTSILNSRLKKVSNNIISNIQAGFREGFSTMDHVFTIVSIINLYQKMGIDLLLTMRRPSTPFGETAFGINW